MDASQRSWLAGAEITWDARSIPELVAANVTRNGCSVAVESEVLDIEDDASAAAVPYHLSHAELLLRSEGLAAELRRRTVEGSIVAVCLQRTPALVVALLGILTAGAAYLPLEPTHPGARLRFLLEDSGACCLVTCWCARRRNLMPEEKLIRVTAIDGQLIGGSHVLSVSCPDADTERPAYLLYTSGSTGTPKGVLVPQRGVLNVLHSMNAMIGGGKVQKLLATTTYCFDISVLEIFWPLCFGFSLFLVSANTSRNGSKLASLLEIQGADVLQGTPALWRSLVSAGWQGHEGLCGICGGEAFPVNLVEPLCRAAQRGLWNAYGPTEATIWATSHAIRGCHGSSVPIGLPLPNVQVALDEAAADEDGTGELLISGVQVALGYHGRPELTANSFQLETKRRVYRTGDLARFSQEGLEFLGRMDQQVKFRGFRIELGEIEAVLERHPLVHSAAAALSAGVHGPTLLAFVQSQNAAEPPKPSDLRSHLAAALPAYMVPQQIHLVEVMPLTASGKLDRKALVETAPSAGSRSRRPPVALKDAVAAAVASIASVETVDWSASLASLGVDSVSAAPLAERLSRDVLGGEEEVPLDVLLADSSLTELCAFQKMDGGNC